MMVDVHLSCGWGLARYLTLLRSYCSVNGHEDFVPTQFQLLSWPAYAGRSGPNFKGRV
jgi:hypothetical protein